MGNSFTQALTQKDARTWNNAISNSTSGNSVLDYFAKCGSYRGRTTAEVNADMASIFADNQEQALKVLFYNRMVTRKTKGFVDTNSVQRGQGQKDEFVKSMAWLENNHPDLLYKNLWLVPTVGCWKDLWYDSTASGFYYYVNPKVVYALVRGGLQNEYHRGLLAKYLPKIRSRKNVNSDRHRRLNRWAKGLCEYLGWSERDYRKFKSNPEHKAHLWQRVACDRQWSQLDFNTVPGRALFQMISQKGKDRQNLIQRHNLEKQYLEWIQSKPVAKFTGYPYELYRQAASGRDLAQTYTYNKQFDGLIKLAKDSVNPDVLKKGVLCALDTSGSMSCGYVGQGDKTVAPIDVCVGLGIYFSSLLQGHFADHVVMFDNESTIVKLQGNFCEKVDQIARHGVAWGSTNFQSVIDEIVRVRKQNPEVPIENYPQVLLVVSDMQFNPTYDTKTNYEMAMEKLKREGLPEMTVIWWQVNGRFTGDVPSTMFDPGTVLISGYDGAIVTAILGGQEEVVDKVTGEKRKLTPYEQMEKALDQELLNQVQL